MANVAFRQNPDIDYLIWLWESYPIPTKQDWFKALNFAEIDEDQNELRRVKFYELNKEIKELQAVYIQHLKLKARNIIKTPIAAPKPIEIILSVSVNPERFNKVDVDNLAKCTLDALKEIAFDDDSQIVTLVVKKFIHVMEVDSIVIGITEITNERKGVSKTGFLFSEV
jgi:Holliday junction resolvase RusA-like endonuclease